MARAHSCAGSSQADVQRYLTSAAAPDSTASSNSWRCLCCRAGVRFRNRSASPTSDSAFAACTRREAGCLSRPAPGSEARRPCAVSLVSAAISATSCSGSHVLIAGRYRRLGAVAGLTLRCAEDAGPLRMLGGFLLLRRVYRTADRRRCCLCCCAAAIMSAAGRPAGRAGPAGTLGGCRLLRVLLPAAPGGCRPAGK